MELDSAFAEKIVMKNDNEFHCKDCPIFVTSIRLLARTHAQSFSSKKKKAGRKPKKISCAECGAACEGRKGLANHFKVSHIISSYNCAQCPKTFKCRKNFANRLKIHDETVGVKCPHCPKILKYDSYKRRHVQRVHKAALNPPSVSGDVVVELNLNVRSKEDWNDWFHMSGIPNLPVSSTGLVDEVELAVAEVTVAGHENEMVETQDNDVYDEVLVEIEGSAVEPDIVSEELLPQQQGIESAKDDEVDAGGSQKPSLLSCPHCDQSGFKDNWFLGRHIQRMHHVPIKCEI